MSFGDPSRRYRFLTTDVFTDTPFEGNPLAVLPDARGLDGRTMQRIAREFNFSETAFVLPPDSPAHTRRVRIFTPGTEVPFAGHPTIGTAFVLATIGEIDLREGTTEIVLEEGVGAVPVTIDAPGGRPGTITLTAARAPERGPEPPGGAAIARCLRLGPEDVLTGDRGPAGWTCGLPFLFVTVRDRATLARAGVDRAAWDRDLAGTWAPDVFVLCFEPEREGSDVRARMFAPGVGVEEDPATGSACAALAGYLGEHAGDGTSRWTVEQGFEMGRPSLLRVEARKEAGRVVEVRVGGAAVLVSEGMIVAP